MSATAALGARERRALDVQRGIGRLLAPLWIPACASVMRFGFGWRVEGVRETRRTFAQLRRQANPLLVCANHLTLVDSFLIATALGSPWWFVARYSSLPWNVPDWENFARRRWMRWLTYVMKCIPVKRGGDRREVGRVLARITDRLARGEVVLVFPEGGRSRSARVDTEASTYGVGRIVKALPGCRVLCVYLRGERQERFSDLPARGERFRVSLDSFEPKAEQGGMRGTVEILRQILGRLAGLEQRTLHDRQ